jgi:hypothetical protein
MTQLRWQSERSSSSFAGGAQQVASKSNVFRGFGMPRVRSSQNRVLSLLTP